ncbi:MAG: ABC transporter ATP-binding protein [Anaerolineales bacterium]
MIELRNFSYRYPNQTRPALAGIQLKIPKGQFCGVVGANGAGKSTLCYALSGFVPHFYRGDVSGILRIGGREIAQTTLGILAGEIGLVFQDPFNQISGARFSVREEVAFGLENLGLARRKIETRVSEVLGLMRLAAIADRSPFELSGGQQQRVAIASILAMQPKVLVLDEPTSQLDPHGTAEVFEALDEITRDRETTVVIVEHKLEWLAEFADRVVVLDAGRVVMDGPARKVLADDGLKKLGIGRTQYSEAAASAQKKRLFRRSGILPITLKQARAFFK